jgi:cell division septation protein DedD
VLLVVVIVLLAAGRFGLVDIPGITPSGGASVDDADAAEVARDATGESVEGPAETSIPSTPASPTGGEPSTTPPPADGAGGAPENPLLAFALTLGSFEDLPSAEARAVANRRTFPDLEFVVAPVEVDGRAWFRLLAGPASDRAAVDGVRERLVGGGRGGGGDWIVRRAPLAFLVAAHSSLPLARRNVQALEDSGIPSYVLVHRGENGAVRYRVYVGAYANAAEAGYMARILDENRIEDAQLTERRGVRP